MPSATDASATDTGESADGWAGGERENKHGELNWNVKTIVKVRTDKGTVK